jgi:hypothetical protein
MNEKEYVEDIQQALASQPVRDLTNAPAEHRFNVLQALIVALGSGLNILKRHADGEPEPFPGATKAVIAQQLACIELARKGGLLP